MSPRFNYGLIIGIAVFMTAMLFFLVPPKTAFENGGQVDDAQRGMFYAVARAGKWIAAVGEHGRIVNSWDNGKTWTRANVPVDVPLTCIYLLDRQLGWAAGYDGVILITRDGGFTWERLRGASAALPPIFALWFKDASLGIAVGAGGMVYRTVDAGKNWNVSSIGTQAHLYTIAHTDDGILWVAGEDRALFNSHDGGLHWYKIAVPFPGSFFTGIPLPENRVMFAGLRGRVAVWAASGFIATTQEADENFYTAMLMEQGHVVLAGGRGRVLLGGDKGWPFRLAELGIENDISAIVDAGDALIVTGDFGIQRILKTSKGVQ